MLQQQVGLMADSRWDSLLVAGACVGSRNASARLIYIKRMCSHAKRQAPLSTRAPLRSWSGGATGSALFRFIIILPILGLDRNGYCGFATSCVKGRPSNCNQFALKEEGTFKEENSSSGEALASSLHKLNRTCKWLHSMFDAVNVTSIPSLLGSSRESKSCMAHLEGT